MRIFLTLLCALMLGGGGAYAWLYYGGFEGERSSVVGFIDAYSTYDVSATRVAALVHSPSTEKNSDRSELLALLQDILTGTLTNDEREALARVAFTHLDSIQKGIADAAVAQDELYLNIQNLDTMSRIFTGMRAREQAHDLVSLARACAETSARIIANLSETHEHTYAIITRVLEDGGELTDEHKRSINAITTEAETRHAELEAHYTSFVAQRDSLTMAFDQFVHDLL